MAEIYQAGTKVWAEIEEWAAKDGSHSCNSCKCLLELRSRIERLEEP